jgi:hypothetical protein
VSVTLDIYLDGKFFYAMDKDHYVLKKAGREVDMLTEQSGVVRGTPGDGFIRSLSSFRHVYIYVVIYEVEEFVVYVYVCIFMCV